MLAKCTPMTASIDIQIPSWWDFWPQCPALKTKNLSQFTK